MNAYRNTCMKRQTDRPASPKSATDTQQFVLPPPGKVLYIKASQSPHASTDIGQMPRQSHAPSSSLTSEIN